MKKYILAFLAAGCLTGCGDDFLKEKVVNTLTSDFYKSVEGLESLTTGTYQILRFKPDYNQGHYLFGACSDIEVYSQALTVPALGYMGSYSNQGWGPMSETNTYAPHVNALIGQVSNVAEGSYPIINRCNIFLENYEGLSEADKKTLEPRRGEILFLRTYAYYLISNVLGDVPWIEKSFSGMPDNFYFPKMSLEDLYVHLITDMTEAVGLLPATSSELGRITKPAAAHFLAKLYLHRAQAAEFQNSSEPTLKALYKGNASGVSADLQKAIEYATMTIDAKKNNSQFGGLSEDFANLWLDQKGSDPFPRDKEAEILLSAQYEASQKYNGRYPVAFVHLYNSDHTSLNAATPRTIEYGRPYATVKPTDWAYDMYTDRANDSRYYKTYLTDYVATGTTGSKSWDPQTAYIYNTYIKSASDAPAVAGQPKISFGKRSIVYIENDRNEPLDSLWVMSQPFIMNVRWTVGSPAGKGYFLNAANPSQGLKPGIDMTDPVITNATGRTLVYRVAGHTGDAFGLDRANRSWYLSPRKWLDINRGNGTNVNGNASIDFPIFRLAETYLIRAEAYGRAGDEPAAIEDINMLRKRAAYKKGDQRPDVLVTMEPSVLTGKLSIPAADKQYPYTVTEDAYEKIRVTGQEWQSGHAKARLENYPEGATNLFVHFIYNERARELGFEFNTWEDLHNAGILYERIYSRDAMGAPPASRGTTAFPFPVDDVSTTNGALGQGKGQFSRVHTFHAWPQSYLNLLTDENGNPLSDAAKQEYQNYGY